MSYRKFLNQEFSAVAIVLIPLCVAINCISGQVAAFLQLPIFLDTIGTVFTGMICGPTVAITVGILTNLISAAVMPTMLPFIFVNIALGYTTGFLAKHKMLNNPYKMIISALIISLVSIVTAAPIVVLLYSGFTGGSSSIFTGLLMASGTNIWISVFSADGFFTLLDRCITLLICYRCIRCLPPNLLLHFKFGLLYVPVYKNEKVVA